MRREKRFGNSWPRRSRNEVINDEIPLHDGDVLVDSLNIQEDNQGSNNNSSDTSFQESRATLDMERNKILSMLAEAESSASSSKEKEKASEERLKLLKYMEQEKTLETLIKNKELPNCFVVITDKGVNVTVQTDQLDQTTVTKISEIIMRQTDRPASEIVVQDAS